ncbi:MAG: apolipoprotein N-acyltransferase, partial [Gammaproteobacteria bacterium]|nr:apolipoprotein N-acyltransferase [Gammaproteobacteria bacterium]
MAFNVPVAEFADRRPWPARGVFFLAGVLTMLSFAPFGLYPLALVFVIPLLYAFRHCQSFSAARLGFAWGAGLFLAGSYWLYVSIHVFGQAPLILAIILMVGLVIIMAFYYAAAGWIIATLRDGNPWQFVAIAPATWVFLEWLRGWFLSGFPWMTLGYSQIDSSLAGFAPGIGIFGVSLMLMLSASAILAALESSGRTRIALALVAAVPWFAGAVLKPIEWTTVAGPPVKTTLVQGGVSQDQKWLREQFEKTLDLYRSALLEHSDSDLVLWPEVAIPAVLDQVEGYVSLLQRDVAASDSTLLFGILERDSARERVFNSVIAIDGSSRQVYRKRHLVPFGEYFPVPEFVREWMRMMNLPYSDISSGAAKQELLTLPDGNRLSVAICYEDAYAAEQLYALADATILINVSNDAWFGDSIAPHQHLEIARMRALEAGRHVVRATNNGISAFIGPDGAILESGPQFEYLTMTRDVIPRTGTTPYARVGNWPVIVLSTLIPGWFAWRRRSRKS